MRPRSLCLLLLAAALLAGAGCGGSAGERTPALPPARALPVSSSSHVVVLVMENKERGDVVGAPASRYVNALARRYAIATSSYAVTPSVAAQLPGAHQRLDAGDHVGLHGLPRRRAQHRRPARGGAPELEGVHGGSSEPVLAGRRRRALRQEARPLHVLRRRRAQPAPLPARGGLRRPRPRPAARHAARLRLRLARPLPRHPRLRRRHRRPLPRRASSPGCCASWARAASSS